MTDEVKYYKVRDTLGRMPEALFDEESSRTVELGAREVVYMSGRSVQLVSFRLCSGSRTQAVFLLNREDLLRILKEEV